MFRTFCASMALVAGMFAGLSTAQAQDIQTFRPAPGVLDYLSVDGAWVQLEGSKVDNKFELVPSLVFTNGHRPLVMEAYKRYGDLFYGNGEQTVVKDLSMLHVMVGASYDRFVSVALDMPFAWVQGDVVDQYNDSSFALGDLRLHAKWRFFHYRFKTAAEKREMEARQLERRTSYGDDRPMTFDDESEEDEIIDYTVRDNGLAAALVGEMTFPTGDESHLVGEALSAQLRVVGEVRTSYITAALNLGYKLRSEMQKFESLHKGNELTYAAALSVPLGTRKLLLLGELFGALPMQDIPEESASSPLETMGGLRWSMGFGPVLTAGGGTSLIADAGAAQWRVMFGFSWHNQNYDLDGDGVLDKDDLCPDEPEDIDGFEDEDGCPDLDNDQDGILDVLDRCPNEPEDRDGFEDEDGCPDLDNDQDGIPDSIDRCPNQPEVINGYMDEDGCPDTVPEGFIAP